MIAPTGAWMALQQWAAAIAPVADTRHAAEYGLIQSQLSRVAKEAGLSHDVLRAEPRDLPGLLAAVEGTELANRVGDLLSGRLVDYFRRRSAELTGLQGDNRSEVSHPLFRRPIAPRTLESMDDIRASVAGIKAGLAYILKSLVLLYQRSSETPLFGFDPAFQTVLRSVRGEAVVVAEFSEEVRTASLQSIEFRTDSYQAALREIKEVFGHFDKVEKIGLTHLLAANIRSNLLEIARHIDPASAQSIEESLPVYRPQTIHPKTASSSQIQGALLGAAVGAGHRSDDTLLVQETLQAILETEAFVPRKIAERFSRLDRASMPPGFGPSSNKAIKKLSHGSHRMAPGEPETAEEGTTTRVIPVALLDYRSLDVLRRDVILSGQITHQSYESMAAAMAVAFILAKILRQEFRPESILLETKLFIGPGRVANRLAHAHNLLKSQRSHEEAIAEIGIGGLARESVVAAIYAFVAMPHDFGNSILLVTRSGGDTGAMASITGALSGAYNGADVVPSSWRTEVENADGIVARADRLFHLVHSKG